MISRCGSDCQPTEKIPEEAVVDTSYSQSARQLCDVPHGDDIDGQNGICMLCTEDEKLISGGLISNNLLLLKEPCFSFHDQDYFEKIKEFQFYVDMVTKITRPGCSPEVLNVALASMSSLLKKLYVMSSKQHFHASL